MVKNNAIINGAENSLINSMGVGLKKYAAIITKMYEKLQNTLEMPEYGLSSFDAM